MFSSVWFVILKELCSFVCSNSWFNANGLDVGGFVKNAVLPFHLFTPIFCFSPSATIEAGHQFSMRASITRRFCKVFLMLIPRLYAAYLNTKKINPNHTFHCKSIFHCNHTKTVDQRVRTATEQHVKKDRMEMRKEKDKEKKNAKHTNLVRMTL